MPNRVLDLLSRTYDATAHRGLIPEASKPPRSTLMRRHPWHPAKVFR